MSFDAGLPLNHFDFNYKGFWFRGAARAKYVVVVRYSGSGRVLRQSWHHMDSFLLPNVAGHVFERAANTFERGDVYCIDVEVGEVVAHASKGELLLDRIDPHHTFNAEESEP